MKKDRVENLKDAKRSAEPEADDKRQRSTIQFPYNDLDDAVEIAKAIHDNAGTDCTVDQLAAYLKVSMTSGAFRVRMANASTFGITENERGSLRLTDLGRRIADSSQEATARSDAFLHVPLYAKVYEHFKGYTLPGAAALEKYMADVGVAKKQTDKARQAMMRSAKQAGFFAHGEDRLVRPAGPGTKPLDGKIDDKNKSGDRGKGGNGSGGGGNDITLADLDPIILGLLRRIPKAGTVWPKEVRSQWLDLLEGSFQLIYKESSDKGSASDGG